MRFVTVPGRVNLIGEHIDYHNLPVLPMAIQRRIRIDYESINEPVVRGHSEAHEDAEINLSGDLVPGPAGDWSNYIKAAINAARTRWNISHGIEAKVASDLPAAAGLSSSSALMTGFTIALLRANGIEPSIDELMEVLPEGEQFVGTRGGGMDHAAVLASRAGSALLVEFAPLRLMDVPIPDTWSFIVAHSLKTAEKSGAAREYYNGKRVAGQNALTKLGLASFRCAVEQQAQADLSLLNDDELRTLRHVVSEFERVRNAVAAFERADKEAFGALLYQSHRSLRDDLRVSCEPADRLAEACLRAGAAGARIMGAGFGGYVVGLCETTRAEEVLARIERDHFSKFPERAGFPDYLMAVEAGDGALTHDS